MIFKWNVSMNKHRVCTILKTKIMKSINFIHTYTMHTCYMYLKFQLILFYLDHMHLSHVKCKSAICIIDGWHNAHIWFCNLVIVSYRRLIIEMNCTIEFNEYINFIAWHCLLLLACAHIFNSIQFNPICLK